MTSGELDDKNLLTVSPSVHEGGGGGVTLSVHGVGGEGSSDEGQYSFLKEPGLLYESSEDEEDESSEDEEDESSEDEKETYTLESPIIKIELDRIFDEIHEKGDTVIWRLPKTVIIAFVDILEEAHDYFKLNEYLEEECPFIKPHCPVDKICELLEKEVKERFDKVNPCTIPRAVQARLWQLEAEHEIELKYQYMIYLRKFDYAQTYKPDTLREIQVQYPNLDSSEILNGLQWYRLYLMTCEEKFSFPKEDQASYIRLMDEKRRLQLQRLQNQENKMAMPLSPIYALASRAYKEGYVMNRNLEMEVRKIRRYDHCLNFLFLTDGPMENLLYQARTVIVSNVSLSASTQDINKLLSSSGDIEDIQIERGRKFKTAHVTFKDSEGTEAALRLQDPEVQDVRVIITPTIEDTPRQYLRAATSVSSAVEKAEDIKIRYNEALKKYQELRDLLPSEQF